MLLKRSIFLQACFLLSVCNSQDYEGSYHVDEAEIQDESGPVDYSKYYSVDTSAPLVSQGNLESIGFTSPIEFSGFFGAPLEFGASSKQEVAKPKNPFVAQTQNLGFISNEFPQFFSSGTFPVDYFEEAQKKHKNGGEDHFESGANYISHHVTPENLDTNYSSDVEQFEAKPVKPKKNQDSRETAEPDTYQPDYDYEPVSKYADYNTGKSSSTVKQHPQASGYQGKKAQAPTPTPYEKYSFQPVTQENFKPRFLGNLISTAAPFYSTSSPNFEAQSSETIPEHLKGKNCRRIKKQVPGEGHERSKREAMNCYVCEDADNKAKYTRCSYAVETEPKNDYSGVSERYSTPGKEPDGFRYKRYANDYDSDPYEYIRKQSQKAYTDAQESKDYEDYKIPEFYTSGPEKSYSEAQSEKITKNPGNCHKKESDGMTCTICKDPKTGGNYEQCSYTSEPKEQKYAYVTEKKYDSNDEPSEGSESSPAVQGVEPGLKNRSEPSKPSEEYKSTTLPSIDYSKYSKLEDFKPEYSTDYSKLKEFKPAEIYKANYRGPEKLKLSNHYNPDKPSDSRKAKTEKKSRREEYDPPKEFESGDRTAKKLIDDEPYDVPKHFAESTLKEQKSDVKGLEPDLYGGGDSSEAEGEPESADSSSQVEPYKDIDEYHFKLFPEFSNQESQQSEVVAKDPSSEATRKDVEEVLAEFSKKDRTACKKAEKNGMTCYLCVDEKGIQHEECMYVSESKPQASHLAYHEVKQIKSPNDKKSQEQIPAEIKHKRYVKKVATTPGPFSLLTAASEEFETKVKYTPNKSRRKRGKKVKTTEEYDNTQEPSSFKHDDPELLSDEEESRPKTPKEFEVGAKEGAYSAETRPVYSKLLGVKLPRYMVDKSEFEKEFDEFAYNK